MICLVPAAAHAGNVERYPAGLPGVEMAENPGNGEAADHAAGPGYDFVEIGWSALDATHSGDGPAVNVSVSISDHAFLYGNASFVDFEHNAGDADTWRLGAGLHTPVSTQWDVVVRGSAQHIDEGRHASSGFQYEAGLKGKVTPQLEAWIMAGQSNWRDDNFHDQTFVRLGVLYEFNHHWGVTADVVHGRHETETFIGVSRLF
jgi:hypothetical protein